MRAYRDRTPGSAAAFAAAARVLPGGETRAVTSYPPYPVIITEGHGARLTDADGHQLPGPGQQLHVAGARQCVRPGHRGGGRPAAARHRVRQPASVPGRPGRAAGRPAAVGAPGPVHQLGHRGVPAGGQDRRPGHRTPAAAPVRGRLPRQRRAVPARLTWCGPRPVERHRRGGRGAARPARSTARSARCSPSRSWARAVCIRPRRGSWPRWPAWPGSTAPCSCSTRSRACATGQVVSRAGSGSSPT